MGGSGGMPIALPLRAAPSPLRTAGRTQCGEMLGARYEFGLRVAEVWRGSGCGMAGG